MNRIVLPHTGRSTSQLGFGGSSLMGAISRRTSLALLEHAFDRGVRHFDVAPMYGYGTAESCLGEFLSRHPGQVTVTTKFGIPPPANQRLLRLARRAAAPLLQRLPGMRRRLAGAANAVVNLAPSIPLTPANARLSLDSSLAALRIEMIDLFLLHEARAEDLKHEGLQRFLEDAVAAGKIGAFGCGSTAAKIPSLLLEAAAFCSVLQFEWSVLDLPVQSGSAFTLHHRALTENFAALRAALTRDADLALRWSKALALDLKQPGVLSALMLKAALVCNPGSIVLVSSRNQRHIEENVEVASDTALAEPARKLFSLAQRERAAVLAQM